MSLLTSKLPSAVTVDGEDYPVRTDFRVWIKFGSLCDDLQANFADVLMLCYIEALPPTLGGALNALAEFYMCGKELSRTAGSKTPIVSFDDDGEYIYSAYLNQYGIDLTTADLHWYQFMALFKALDDDCKLSKIMEARAIKLGDIKDKGLKAYYRKMKQAYKLPDHRTEKQKERDMMAALESLF